LGLKKLISNSATGENFPTLADGIENIQENTNKILAIVQSRNPDNELLIALVDEANGRCLGTDCGAPLINRKHGRKPTLNCKVVYASVPFGEQRVYDAAVALCYNCASQWPQMAQDEQRSIIERRIDCANRDRLYSRIANVDFAQELESVLRAVETIKDSPDLPEIKLSDLVETERKIIERRLLDRIKADMTRLFLTVNEIFGQLEQETGFNSDVLGRNMKYAIQTLQDELRKKANVRDPQTRMVALLSEKLYYHVGQQYREACEIIVEYLVKRCDLFDADAKQSK